MQETITTPLGPCSLAAAATPALASGEFKAANFGVCPSLMAGGPQVELEAGGVGGRRNPRSVTVEDEVSRRV